MSVIFLAIKDVILILLKIYKKFKLGFIKKLIVCIFMAFYHTGFEETNKGCCGTGLFEVTPILCDEITPVCHDPSKYIFWDSVHPTEVTYMYIAKYIEMEVLPKFQFHMDYLLF